MVNEIIEFGKNLAPIDFIKAITFTSVRNSSNPEVIEKNGQPFNGAEFLALAATDAAKSALLIYAFIVIPDTFESILPRALTLSLAAAAGHFTSNFTDTRIKAPYDVTPIDRSTTVATLEK